jgi:uncharacterized protein
MQFLVDGYNLMHAMGYLVSSKSNRAHPTSLDADRRRCLDWLATIVRERDCVMRVVFDGQNAPRQSAESVYRGVRVRFAFRQTADDVIETILDEGGDAIVVVSNDTRLHESARRANARSWSTQQFLDWVVEPPKSPEAVTPQPEKPLALSADAEAELLQVFSERPVRRTSWRR